MSKGTEWNCDQLMKWLVCIRMAWNYIYISLRMWEYTYFREGELPILFESSLYINEQFTNLLPIEKYEKFHTFVLVN